MLDIKLKWAIKAIEIAIKRLEEIQYQKASHETIKFLKEILELINKDIK